MRPQKVTDQQLMERLMEVIRAKGYDGASLNDLANASGLKKASLYHRFPGGKFEITQAVLEFVGNWVENNIWGVLADQTIKPKTRLQMALSNIRALYDEGSSMCILRVLTTETGVDMFGQHIALGFETWLDAFQILGTDLGFNRKKSKQMAFEGLVKIQGSLIVSKALGNNKTFQDAIKQIYASYLT